MKFVHVIFDEIIMSSEIQNDDDDFSYLTLNFKRSDNHAKLNHEFNHSIDQNDDDLTKFNVFIDSKHSKSKRSSMISAKIENIENEIFEIEFDSKSNDSMNFENVDEINDNLMSFQKSTKSINQKSIDSRRSKRTRFNIKSYARIQNS